MLKLDEQINVLTDRVKKRKEEYLSAEVHLSGYRSRLVTQSWRETEGQPLEIRRAKAFKKILEGIPICIREGELIVGSQTEHIRGVCPVVDFDRAETNRSRIQQAKVAVISPGRHAVVNEEVRQGILDDLDYWEGKTIRDRVKEAFTTLWGNQWSDFLEVRVCRDTIHSIGARTADWRKVLNMGFNGIIAEAMQEIAKLQTFDEHETRKYYLAQAIIIVCEGVINYARRFAVLAAKMAEEEKDPARKLELCQIADIFEHVPANPARNFREALQSFFTSFLALHLETGYADETPGRFDQYMYPFYKKDLEEGRLTQQDAAELLGLLVVKFMEFDTFGTPTTRHSRQGSHNINVTLGGMTKEGLDGSNGVSMLFLEAIRRLRPHQPHVSLRYHDGISRDFMVKAVETNRDHGGGIPAFFNDKPVLLGLTRKGIPLSEARDWIPQGCVERTSGPSSSMMGSGPFYNLPKILEITLNNGIDPRTGKRIGLQTGDPRAFTSFEELYGAFKTQVGWFVDRLIQVTNLGFVVRQENYALPYNSALLTGCLESGKDALAGGARWGAKFLACLRPYGHANTVNSLAAIKKLVYEDKKLSMDELLASLTANFEGKAEIQAMLLAAPKWGNDDDYVDSIMVDLYNWTAKQITGHINPWGQPWIISRQGLTYHYWFGEVVGASADGRRSGEPLADGSVSAMRGTDKKGPTAVMNSASKVDHVESESTLLNLKFSPAPLRSSEGIEKFISLIKTYFDNCGYLCQFNIVNTETLLDAKKHPEKYRDLVVRVAGFSAFFVDLAPSVQDEIISRTGHAI
ncbi:MAG: hypothetical protein HYX87_04010 [Chloroflexi bacterium]|nr:hypothetical protein [Chloroflexota bacterium]